MIAKLVIGSVSGNDVDEIASPPERHPHGIRKWVEQIRRGVPHWTVCTFSPTVIRAVIDSWDKDPSTFSRIVLRSDDGKDTPLLDVKDAQWLAHFAIEDLYLRGEFDAALKGKS